MQWVKMATATNIVKKKSAKSEVKEDGHTDVASAIRQCKTVTEDAMQILQKLKSMRSRRFPSFLVDKQTRSCIKQYEQTKRLLFSSICIRVELNELVWFH